MLGTDEILRGVNREPIFAPMLGGILNSVLPENVHKDSARLINSNIDQLVGNNEEIKLNNSLLDRFQGLNLKGDLTKDEFNEFRKVILENKQNLIKDNEMIKGKILEMINNIKKSN